MFKFMFHFLKISKIVNFIDYFLLNLNACRLTLNAFVVFSLNVIVGQLFDLLFLFIKYFVVF